MQIMSFTAACKLSSATGRADSCEFMAEIKS